MKWFKHISDSLDDPLIFDLITEFGSDGYLVFFGVIEKYSREFSPENEWKLVINPAFFRQKFRISSAKVKNILSKIHKWEIEYKDDKVCIFIPKFKELLDNWTAKQIPKNKEELRSNYKVSIQPIRLKNKIKDKETNIGDKSPHAPRKIFQIPTIQDITSYCQQRKNTVNPETFFSHYNSNGWMVGKNKMKDWKSAIITWESRGGNNVGFNTSSLQTRKMDTGQEQSLRNADRIREEYEAAIAASNDSDR